MESDQDKPGPGNAITIEPFKERNGETWGARVTRSLPGEPCVLPNQDVKEYRGHKSLSEMLVLIGLDEEDRLNDGAEAPDMLH